MAIPNSTGAPVLSSNRVQAYIGATLTSTVGTWTTDTSSPFTDTFQWRKGGVDIDGATASTLVLATENFAIGDVITCNVTRTNADGAASRLSSSMTIITSVPVSTVQTGVAIPPGGPILSNTLIGGPGTWTGWPVPTFTYQWRLNGADLEGATSANLSLAARAIGDSLVLRCTATNSEGSTDRDSPAIVVTPDFDVPVPGVHLPVTKALAVDEVWAITMLGNVQLFVDGAPAGYTRTGTNTKSIRFKAAGTYTLSTNSPLEKCVVTVT